MYNRLPVYLLYFATTNTLVMQKQQKIFIKGMVCLRCISTVKNELENIGLQLEDISLGEVTIAATTLLPDPVLLEERLKPLGFSLLEDKRKKLVNQVKKLVQQVYSGEYDFPVRFRFAELLTNKLGIVYDTASSIFSASENTTIERYIIDYRIEKVKEFLVYTNDTLADISFKLGFSSVAHLSRQFKTETGLNPSYFKEIRGVQQASRGYTVQVCDATEVA